MPKNDEEHFRVLAVSIIENAYLSWRNRKIFAFLKSTLAASESNSTLAILKKVSPVEADLLSDPSFGARLRLRLGGATFPPRIFYKVFINGSSGVSTVYMSGRTVIASDPSATNDTIKLMGKTKYVEQLLRDIEIDECLPPGLLSAQDYMRARGVLDSLPACLGGRSNEWREFPSGLENPLGSYHLDAGASGRLPSDADGLPRTSAQAVLRYAGRPVAGTTRAPLAVHLRVTTGGYEEERPSSSSSSVSVRLRKNARARRKRAKAMLALYSRHLKEGSGKGEGATPSGAQETGLMRDVPGPGTDEEDDDDSMAFDPLSSNSDSDGASNLSDDDDLFSWAQQITFSDYADAWTRMGATQVTAAAAAAAAAAAGTTSMATSRRRDGLQTLSASSVVEVNVPLAPPPPHVHAPLVVVVVEEEEKRKGGGEERSASAVRSGDDGGSRVAGGSWSRTTRRRSPSPPLSPSAALLLEGRKTASPAMTWSPALSVVPGPS